MERRFLLRLGAMIPFALLGSRYLNARASKVSFSPDYRKRAQQVFELAADIQSPGDARRLVELITELFSKSVPATWINSSLQNQIAKAEFSAVSDSRQLISEHRLAMAWNGYVETIHASEDYQVTSAEVHKLRDVLLTSARLSWESGTKNIWAVPSIYATQPNGRLAPGCRAIESIRLLWDLANAPENLKSVRDPMSSGVLASDVAPKQLSGSRIRGAYVVVPASGNPMEVAARQYAKLNGDQTFNNAVTMMLHDILM